jgi:hypothetical protein
MKLFPGLQKPMTIGTVQVQVLYAGHSGMDSHADLCFAIVFQG